MYHSLAASQINYGIIIWGSQFALNIIGDSSLDLTHIPDNLECLEVAHKKNYKSNSPCTFKKKS